VSIDAGIRRGKLWVQPDGATDRRFLGSVSDDPAPPFGTVFMRDDPYVLEIYGHNGKLEGQVWLSDEQRRAIVQFLGARG
jgi:hypothetical protein